MLLILSPAKTLDFETRPNTNQCSAPLLTDKAKVLIDLLKKYSVDELMKLMAINRQLAILNYERIQTWQPGVVKGYSKQAVCAFKGEVYHGLEADNWDEPDFTFAQEHLVILSGLYGVLRPLDLINPFRLEMGSKLQNPSGSTLYQYWETTINHIINQMIEKQKNPVLINLASNEYYKAILPKKLKGTIITPVFKDFKEGVYQNITIYAKKARGSMARFIVTNQVENTEDIKAYDLDGYLFNARLSKGHEWVFTRENKEK